MRLQSRMILDTDPRPRTPTRLPLSLSSPGLHGAIASLAAPPHADGCSSKRSQLLHPPRTRSCFCRCYLCGGRKSAPRRVPSRSGDAKASANRLSAEAAMAVAVLIVADLLSTTGSAAAAQKGHSRVRHFGVIFACPVYKEAINETTTQVSLCGCGDHTRLGPGSSPGRAEPPSDRKRSRDGQVFVCVA